MLLLGCKSDINPCPLIDQIWVQSASLANFADSGITPEQMLYVVVWGFGVVLLGFLMGYVIGIALGLIKMV